ncbi:hypothetical protein NIES2100_13020 [Calothrix sp. NIES-2100]|nr:hypothetical protein NIES2100_13020 [Calothrix sp. NIES-2100]
MVVTPVGMIPRGIVNRAITQYPNDLLANLTVIKPTNILFLTIEN